MSFAVEKGIPLPVKDHGADLHGRRPRRKYPLRDLAVGDSFFVPEDEHSDNRVTAIGVLTSARTMGITVETRCYSNGLRVWRTA